MSRIIIKGLPKGTKEETLRKQFGAKGHITDCSLKYTKEGVFRKFAFIGYKDPQEAEAAVKYFNNSFINTSKIVVELAKDFGDANKPRAWSKYSKESSAYKKKLSQIEDIIEKKNKSKEDKNSKKAQARQAKLDELLGELKDDPDFQEFVQLHRNRTTKATWTNDELLAHRSGGKAEEEEVDSGHEGNEEGEESDEEGSASEDDTDAGKDKLANKKEISDLDYMKSKMGGSGVFDEESDDDDGEDEDSDSSSEEDEGDSDGNSDDNADSDEETSKSAEIVKHAIKMRGLPANVKEVKIREFFKPLKPASIKIPKNAKGKDSFCIATVTFTTEKDTEEAMRRNKNFIGPKRIYLHKGKIDATSTSVQSKPRLWENKLASEKDEDEEGIAESGRLYVRNLAYCCKEEDIEELFAKYGPLTETHLPIDTFTKKIKGFAFVTFMMPEHAVKAYTDLDGKVFQGRMMHILPAKPKKEDNIDLDKLSFKQKKELDKKAQAASSHNWNTLFLGSNVVAEVMADKYGKAKSDILDAEQRQSLGVRLALGETQIVSETRDFLLENGVALDSFSQAAGERSKTVILVKNLPASTKSKEIKDLFATYGTLGRVILPPSGVTAVVEFIEQTEAKNAFRNLAYSKFQHVPLYLEWAPMGVFAQKDKDVEKKKTDEKEEESSSSDEEDEVEPESTLFVKNLNFDTTDETLNKHFEKCGEIRKASVAKKKDIKNPGQFLSMGYGFVEFKKSDSAKKAMKTLQHTSLDDHQIELKISNRATIVEKKDTRKKQDTKKKQKSTKILVRNVPFEAKLKEIKELFGVFGEMKTVRLPKKLSGTGSHRGFAFVDFLTKQDAKRAFKALCHSTHLYGRRLVLEWADTEDSVEQLRKKTASHFHDEGPSKKLKKSAILEDLNDAMD